MLAKVLVEERHIAESQRECDFLDGQAGGNIIAEYTNDPIYIGNVKIEELAENIGSLFMLFIKFVGGTVAEADVNDVVAKHNSLLSLLTEMDDATLVQLFGWLTDGIIFDITEADMRLGVKATKEVAFQFMVNNLLNKEYSYRPMAVSAPRTFVVKMDVTF